MVAIAMIDDDCWQIPAILLHKRKFMTDEGKLLLVLTLVRRNGELIELQTWSPKKVTYAFYNFVLDRTYDIHGKGRLCLPNKDYTTANSTTRRWKLYEASNPLELDKSINCSTNLGVIQRKLDNGPANILGSFQSFERGPFKALEGHSPVQGYYVNLADDEGEDYRVLVWHVPSKRFQFPLLKSRPGDPILLTSVRTNKYNKDQVTFTSLCPPVTELTCVSKSRVGKIEYS